MCVCVCVYNIGKTVLKLQFSDNKDIGLTFIYEITSSCIFASSFAVLDIIFSTPFVKQYECGWTGLILYLDLYSITILDTKLLVENYIYFACVWEFTNHFFLITLGLQTLTHFYNAHTIELIWLVSLSSCI